MARCGCASSTCSCVVADGTNTTVNGDGSQATPYTVNVSNEAIQDAIGAALGAGTCLEYDDVNNLLYVVVSPTAGNTIECTPNGLFSAPGALALGCGLTTDGFGATAVDTSSTFGALTRRNCDDNADVAGTTALPGPDTEGMAIYCDAAGELRTKPEKFTEVAQATIDEGFDPELTTLPFTTSAIQISAVNPSSQYCMCGFVDFAFTPAISGAAGTVIAVDHEVDMGDGIFNAVAGFVMDNRGKSALSSANPRPLLALNVCLDPGETKIIRHRVRFTRTPADNAGAVSISGVAREIRFVGSNL